MSNKLRKDHGEFEDHIRNDFTRVVGTSEPWARLPELYVFVPRIDLKLGEPISL